MSPLARAHCVYCGCIATTRDHVPPKLLLEKPFPPNLYTVPSCQPCNQNASLDEQYFLLFLGQVSISSSIGTQASLGGAIDRALTRAPALEELILQSLSVDEATGRPVISPNMDRLNRVVQKIAIGLFVRHYGRIRSTDKIGPIGVFPYENSVEGLVAQLVALAGGINSKRWEVVQLGIFSYIFVLDPQLRGKIWCLMEIDRSLWGTVCFSQSQSVAI